MPDLIDIVPDLNDLILMSVGGFLKPITYLQYSANFIGAQLGTFPDRNDRVMMAVGVADMAVTLADFQNFLSGATGTVPDRNDYVLMNIGGYRVAVTYANFVAGGWAGGVVPSPVNTVAPAVTGSALVGQVRTVTNGTWNGAPTSYTYQWKAGGVNIAGETASTYTNLVREIQLGTITCEVTAHNASGFGTALSNVAPAVFYRAFASTQCGVHDTMNTGLKSMMARRPVQATEDISSVQLAVQNFKILNGSEIGSAQAKTGQYFVEYPAGTTVQIPTAGTAIATIPAVPVAGAQTDNSVGAIKTDDQALGFTIPRGDWYWILALELCTVGGISYNTCATTVLGGTVFDAAHTERMVISSTANAFTTADLLSANFRNGAVYAFTNTASWCPLAVIADGTHHSAIFPGDSQTVGVLDDFQVSDFRFGLWGGAMAAGYAFVKISVGGAKASDFMTNCLGRSIILPNATRMGVQLGINDPNGTSGAALILLLTNLATIPQAVTGFTFLPGCKKYIMTLPPRSSAGTSNLFSTTTGQLPTSLSQQKQMNTLLASGTPTGYDGVINTIGSLWFDANGTWNVSPRARIIANGDCTSGSKIVTKNTSGADDFAAADVGVGVYLDKGNAGPTPKSSAIFSLNGAAPSQSMNINANAGNTVADHTLSIQVGAITSDGLHSRPAGYAAANSNINFATQFAA